MDHEIWHKLMHVAITAAFSILAFYIGKSKGKNESNIP